MPEKSLNNDQKETPSGSVTPTDPSQNALLGLIKEAITAVPEVKWALGVVGVITAAGLIWGPKMSAAAAIFSFIVMIILMVLLLIFAHAARDYARQGGRAGKVLIWFALILFMILALCMLGSATVNKPWHFKDWIERQLGPSSADPSPAPIKPSITIDIPDGKSLRSIIVTVTNLDGTSPNFKSSCHEPFLKTLVRPGNVTASDHAKLIEQLNYRLINPAGNLEIHATKEGDNGPYDIDCRPKQK